MRWLVFCLLFLQVGCATKYLLPGNRFTTPESQGGQFNSSFEFQQTVGNQLTADLQGGSTKDGVINNQVNRSAFLFATSLFEQFDFTWSHTSSANSLFGVKYQFAGGSRASKSTGHKMAFAFGFGGNEHNAEGKNAVKFELKGREFQYLYGFRYNEMFLLYSNFSYAKYSFSGDVSSRDPRLNNLKPSYETRILSIFPGIEFSINSFFTKLECGYQQLHTSYTKDQFHFLYGYSIGIAW